MDAQRMQEIYEGIVAAKDAEITELAELVDRLTAAGKEKDKEIAKLTRALENVCADEDVRRILEQPHNGGEHNTMKEALAQAEAEQKEATND